MHRFYLVGLLGFTIGISSCTLVPRDDHRFEVTAGEYIEQLLRLYPQWATGLGDHRYDHMMNDYSLEGFRKKLEFQKSFLDSLDRLNPSRMSTVNRIDYQILQNSIRSMIFDLDTLKAYEWNPRIYNPGGAIYSLMARDFAPLEERLQNVKERLRAVPEIVRNARANLKNPPKIYTETAIKQIRGTISLITDDLDRYLDEIPKLRGEFEPIREQASRALEEYDTWLENELLPQSNGDFRLGDVKYRAKLKYTLESNLPMEDILNRAEKDLVLTQAEIYRTALPLFKEYFPEMTDPEILSDEKKVVRMVLDRLADDHPTTENIVDVAKSRLEECEDFVRLLDFIVVPDEPIMIIIMPEFQRGVAIAYCDSPGPLEEYGETFYAISPPPEDWPLERVESYFREYNNYMMMDLTIHEAMPGHYLQIAHSNEFKAPTLVRSIFSSGPFVEGWATYAEQLMVEQEFGGPELKMQQLKMRLRMIINAIIDQKIHTAGMTEDEAMDMMINEGFQEEGEAAGKWRRACLSSTQLSTYYVGNTEINDIRKAWEDKYGEGTDLKGLHDKMLSFGSPPPKYIKELMGL